MSLYRLSFILSFLVLSACSELHPEVFMDNNEAAVQISEGKLSEPKSLLLDAMSLAPFEPALHYNLGLVFSAQESMDSALKSFDEAVKLDGTSEVRFRAAFNLGVLYQKAKNKDLALKAYQEALVHQPDSRETRVNIEFLLQEQQGGGEGSDQNQDQNEKGDGSSNQQKDPNQDGQEENPGENQKYDSGQQDKPQPQQFQSQELSPSDVNKILREIKQQEGRIRMEFNKTGPKEEPRGKDW